MNSTSERDRRLHTREQGRRAVSSATRIALAVGIGLSAVFSAVAYQSSQHTAATAAHRVATPATAQATGVSSSGSSSAITPAAATAAPVVASGGS